MGSPWTVSPAHLPARVAAQLRPTAPVAFPDSIYTQTSAIQLVPPLPTPIRAIAQPVLVHAPLASTEPSLAAPVSPATSFSILPVFLLALLLDMSSPTTVAWPVLVFALHAPPQLPAVPASHHICSTRVDASAHVLQPPPSS